MKRSYPLLLVALFSLLSSQLFATDVFMRIKDASGNIILGESVNTSYVNWTELSSYGSSLSSPITIGGGGGAQIGRSTLDSIQLQLPFSSISLPISRILTIGSRLSEVDIWFTKPNGTSTCACAFYKIHMENVFIANVKEAFAGNDINQQISIKPTKIAWAYYKQSNNGSFPPAPTNQFGWDYSLNSSFNYNF